MQKITPEQLKSIINCLITFYDSDYSSGKTDSPHYEHIEIDGHLFKVGYIPKYDETTTIVDIKITYKGEVNGN